MFLCQLGPAERHRQRCVSHDVLFVRKRIWHQNERHPVHFLPQCFTLCRRPAAQCISKSAGRQVRNFSSTARRFCTRAFSTARPCLTRLRSSLKISFSARALRATTEAGCKSGSQTITPVRQRSRSGSARRGRRHRDERAGLQAAAVHFHFR